MSVLKGNALHPPTATEGRHAKQGPYARVDCDNKAPDPSSLPERFALAAVFALGICALVWFAVQGATGDRIVFGLMVLLVACLDVYECFRLSEGRSPREAILRLCAIALGSAACAVVLEAGTVFGSTYASVLNAGDWSAKRTFTFFFVILSAVLFVEWYWGDSFACKLRAPFSQFRAVLSGRSVAAGAGGVAALGIAGALAALATQHAAVPFALFGASCGAVVAVALATRGIIGEHPEYVFFTAVVCFGALSICVMPAQTNLSWDDQTHFKNAYTLSYVVDAQMTEGEAALVSPFEQESFAHDHGVHDMVDLNESAEYTTQRLYWDFEDNMAYNAWADVAAREGAAHPVADAESSFRYQAIGVLPNACGLWFARLLHLPFSMQFAFGKLLNLLFYATVCVAAIRTIPVKKIALSVVLMVPGFVFLAANYTYDSWVTCLVALFLALVVRDACRGEQMGARDDAALAATLIAAVAPKAVYFPLALITLTIPRSRYGSSAARKRSILLMLGTVLVIVASIVVPMALPAAGAGGGDVRGGSDVSTAGQIAFICGDPGQALAICTGFILNAYLALPNVDQAFAHMGYLGYGYTGILALQGASVVVVAIAGLVDNFKGQFVFSARAKVVALIAFLLAVALVVVALYLSFTPVGYGTVNGVQGRYLFPLVAPLVVFVGSLRISNGAGEGTVAEACLLAASALLAVFFSNVFVWSMV